MSKQSTARRVPLDADRLRSLAMAYTARFATSEARLTQYLRRKLAERGWADAEAPAVEALVKRCAELGLVDDQSYAQQRAAALIRRSYGRSRIAMALQAAGIDRETIAEVLPDDDTQRSAAEAYARRRRFGSFATELVDRQTSARHFAAMVRAGHSFELAREFTAPGGTEGASDDL